MHFDPEALCHAASTGSCSYAPRSIFLTHYAEVRDLTRLAREMKERVVAYVDLATRYLDAPDRSAKLRHGMFAMIATWLDAHGFPRDDGSRHRLSTTTLNSIARASSTGWTGNDMNAF